MPKVYRKNHLTRWSTGWRYKRAVPRDVVDVVGRKSWTKYLSQTTEAAAVIEARKLDVGYDDLIKRVRALSPDERTAVLADGGFEGTATELAKLELVLPFTQAAATFSEADVSLETETVTPQQDRDGDLIEPNHVAGELRSIRAARASVVALQTKIDAKRSVLAKAEGTPLASKLEALIPVWQKANAIRASKTVSKMNLYVRRFVKVCGDLAPSAVTTAHVIKFRDHREDEGDTESNVQNQLALLRSLFAVAVSKKLIPMNPATGIKATKVAGLFADDEGKKPFSGDQIKLLLAMATKHLKPEAALVIKLLAYHGMRSREACQLTPADIMKVAGVDVIRITDAHGGTLKNRFSRRDIPIHPECMELVGSPTFQVGSLRSSLPATM